MTKVFPTGGMSAVMLQSACVVTDGRPGKVIEVRSANAREPASFVVEYPENWLDVSEDGATIVPLPLVHPPKPEWLAEGEDPADEPAEEASAPKPARAPRKPKAPETPAA